MKNLFLFLLYFSFGVLSNAVAQKGTIPQFREKVEITVPKEKFRLYLLIGQSNMAGRGVVEPQDTIGNPRILRLNRQGDWEIAKDPVHFDKKEAGVGLGLTFAREMLAEGDDTVIGLIPCAAGGSSIDMWKTGMYWNQTQSYPYDDALARTKLALKNGTLTGILWHQGEADSSPAKAAGYKAKLETLVAALRQEFNAPSVPFIAGEMADFRTNGALLNEVFHQAEHDIPYFAVVSAKGFNALPDGIHFDAQSQREFGKRYAEKMKTMSVTKKKISLDYFNLERLDSTRTRMTIAASGDNFKSFCFMLEMLTSDAACPTGFYTNNQGYTYLNAARDNRQNPNFLLDHPMNESKEPGKFVYTFNTTNWISGRYLVIAQAHNRPGPGSYEVERKVFYINVGAPVSVIVSNIPSAKHQLIYSKKDVYACFPSLYPMDDGQIGLTFATRTTDRHTDNTGGRKTMLSKDEGQTWVETSDPVYLSSWRRTDGSLARAQAQGWLYADISEEPRLIAEHRHPHRSSDNKVAWLGGILMKVSKDDGHTWDISQLPMPENLSGVNEYHTLPAEIRTSGGIRLSAVYGKKYLSSNHETLGRDEVFIIRSADDGYSWEARPMFPDGLPDSSFGFNETAMVETNGGKILALSRSHIEDCLWQTESLDGGLSWSAPAKTPIKGFPAHVIRLKDGRLLCAYGVRRQAPQGIRAVISADDGKTWDIKNEMIIRGDGAGNPSDLGYPILYQRSDGSILVVYYLTTDGSYPSVWMTTFTVPDKEKYDDAGHRIFSKAEPLNSLKRVGPFVRLSDGSIFAVGSFSYGISKDNGVTWTECYPVNTEKFTMGSPVAVQTRKGTIVVGFTNSKEISPLNWNKTTHCYDPNAKLPTYITHSKDNGKTWSEPLKLHDEWTGMNRGMLETKDGHVVFSTMKMRNHQGRHLVLTYVSTDDGATWKPSNLLDSPNSAGDHGGLMEAAITQLNDGRLWMLIRTNWDYFYESFSSDNGLTWSEYRKTDIDASSSPAAVKRLESGRIIVVWNRLYHKGKEDIKRMRGDSNLAEVEASWQRDELSLMYSDDDGKSWSSPMIVAENITPATSSKNWLSYPHVFEPIKGVIWITSDFGNLRIAVREADLP